MKVCTKCQFPKDEREFYPRKDRGVGALKPRCKNCMGVAGRLYRQSLSPERRASETRRKTLYGASAAGKAYHKAYRESHREQKRTWGRERYSADLNYRLSMRLRVRVGQALTGWVKSGSAVRDLGCTIPELKAWLEAKFYPHPETGEVMSWENWSPTGWHIDHKRALKHFDLTDRKQFLQACNYTNLQPLWAEHNLSKGAREAA